MKTTAGHIALATVTCLTFANCSLNRTLDATQSMPDKIDSTNDQVRQTNNEVKKTNDSLGTMVTEVKKTNGGMDNMNNEVKKTNEEIGKTNLAVHRQTLQVALADMLKDENTHYLYPPLGMMPGGQIFAAEASADELTQLAYVNLNFIAKGLSIADSKDADSIAKTNQAKAARLTSVAILAAFADQTKIDDIIKTQITSSGPYEKTAYQMLMLRYWFIKTFLVSPKLNKRQMPDDYASNPGEIANVVKYSDGLAVIAALPFAAKIAYNPSKGFLTSDGMDDLNEKYTFTLDPKEMASVWSNINKALTNLDPKYSAAGANTAKLVDELKAKVAANLAAPAPQTPPANP